jgi:LysM repeat protein
MWSPRQIGTVLAYAAIPLLLVVGGVALAVAEGALPRAAGATTRTPESSATAAPLTQTPVPPPAQPSPTPTPGRFPTSTTSPTNEPYWSATAPAPTLGATPTELALTSSTPTATFESTEEAALPSSSTHDMGCDLQHRWMGRYIVRPGDTLFHIALRFGTSVWELRQANCKSSSVIVAGERLLVPQPGSFRRDHPFSWWQHAPWWARLRWLKGLGLVHP